MKTRTNMNVIYAGAFTIVLAFASMSFDTLQDDQRKPWKVPDAARKMKNPVAGDAEATAAGKTLYMKHCKSCHGSKGLGDGPKAKELDTPSGDFTASYVTEQTDGELFYKIKEGRDDMPSFKKKLPDDEEMWSIVNFMRTLAK
jgi:mono/diheme cytochrome c family protein